jgi:hypothetical protein
MRYAGDHIAVKWFPAGVYIVEQGEPAASLYLILSGEVEVVQEDADGSRRHLRTMVAGQFFGELAIAAASVRTADVVAKGSVTCLVLSPGRPTAFAPRGGDAWLPGVAAPDDPEGALAGATARVDVGGYVDVKLAAVAAHRSQFPLHPGMFPPGLLMEVFGQEFFVRIHPSVELDDRLG